MITRHSLRPLNAVASKRWTCAACAQSSASIPQQRRTLYSVPKLPTEAHFARDGVKNLFSGPGFRLGWSRYQEMMITKLNELTAGRHYHGKDVKELAIQFAHEPAAASTFNHASMAHNNHFFYQQFSATPKQLDHFPDLQQSLTDQFGSIETLRTTFVDTAAAMFGSGFVWLVWARDPELLTSRKGSWKILCTYNAGTPYPEAGFMQQGIDMNTNNADSLDQYQYKTSFGAGFMGAFSHASQEKAKIPPGSTTVLPVLCVSTWEHTYLYDFGLQRKVDYLNSFWDVIDWTMVNHRTPDEIYKLTAPASY